MYSSFPTHRSSDHIADGYSGMPRTYVRIVDTTTGQSRNVLTVDTIKSLRTIPGTPHWSALIDFGEGQQLYRIDTEGKLQQLIVNPNPVPVGKADMSFPIGGGLRPAERKSVVEGKGGSVSVDHGG